MEIRILGGERDGDHILVQTGAVLRFDLVPSVDSPGPDLSPKEEDYDFAGDPGSHGQKPLGPPHLGCPERQRSSSVDGARSRSPRNMSSARSLCCAKRSSGWSTLCAKDLLVVQSSPFWPCSVSELCMQGCAIFCAGITEGYLLPKAFEVCRLRVPNSANTFAVKGCKVLVEPPAGSPQGQLDAAVQRYWANRLGRGWRYMVPSDAIDIEDEGDETLDEALGDVAIWIHVAVAAPGYSVERLAIALHLPVTPEEAFEGINAARNPARRQHFPRLIAAHPQPCPGSGFVLAVPQREGQGAWVCLDTSSIDGRVFVAKGPAYATRVQLQTLANLPPNLRLRVCVGFAEDPLDDAAVLHMFDGVTVSFLPEDVAATVPYTFAQNLQTPMTWSSTCTVPNPSTAQAYCLVHKQEHVLFVTDFRFPTQYRRQIASCLGITESRVRLSPATPRPRNISLDGMPCRTAIAVSDRASPPDSSSIDILIDARPLCAAWFTLSLPGRWTTTSAIAEECQICLSEEEDLWIDNRAPNQRLIRVTAGQVFEVSASPLAFRVITATNAPAAPVSADTADTGGTGEGTASSQGQAAFPGNDGGANTAGSGGNREASEAGPGAGIPHSPHSGTATNSQYADGVFLIFGQNVSPEMIEVRMPLGLPLGQALAMVAAARLPADTARLPQLLAVHPQPYGNHAALLAVPDWHVDGAVVFIDCRDVNDVAFALQIGSSQTRRGLLVAAGLDSTDHYDVFVGDQPWPVPDDVHVTLHHGDLILISPYQGPVHVVASLQEMLQSATGWGGVISLPGHVEEAAWIIYPGDAFRHAIRPDRRDTFRRDVAESLNLPPNNLSLRAPRPYIEDHAVRGCLNRHVIAAVFDDGTGLVGVRSPVCFLDLRPVMLDIQWRTCWDGFFNPQGLLEAQQSRCPYGLHVCVLTDQGPQRLRPSPFRVQGGEVITVVFAASSGLRDDNRRPGSNDDDQGSSPDDDAPDAKAGRDDRGPAGQASGTSQAPASSDSAADLIGANTVSGHSSSTCALPVENLLVESSFYVWLGQICHCLYALLRLVVLLTFASILLIERNCQTVENTCFPCARLL